MNSIKHFSEIGIKDIPLVGGKNASLGEMYVSLSKKGVAVPEGFAVTSAGYSSFLKTNNLVPQLTQVANPNPPYFVHFLADPAGSAQIDHSRAAPGGSFHRAGHTSIHFRGRGALTWQPETGSPRPDGVVPFFFRSVNVYFRLTDLRLAGHVVIWRGLVYLQRHA